MLSGKAAIVTGASRGIGRGIALSLARHGANLILNATSEAGLETCSAEVLALGRRVMTVAGDIALSETAEALVQAALTEYGKIDIVVNCAGINQDKMLHKITDESWNRVLAVNLNGTFYLTRRAAIEMRKQKSGRIINMSSVVGIAGNAGQANYASSKAGVIGLTKAVARELASRGITVNAIAPGWIDTPMFHKATDNDPPRLAKIMGRIPAKSVGDPMDVGMCAAFLCSEAARYISGTCVPVDGGALIGF